MHDIVVVGVPLLAILAGILFNNGKSDGLEARINSRFDRMDNRIDRLETRLDRMQADLSQFYTITAKHEIRIESLEKRA
jgi:hypothetical protein